MNNHLIIPDFCVFHKSILKISCTVHKISFILSKYSNIIPNHTYFCLVCAHFLSYNTVVEIYFSYQMRQWRKSSLCAWR